MAFVMPAQPVDHHVKTLLILQQRRDVVKENPRLRVVRNFADQLLQIFHSSGSWLFREFNREISEVLCLNLAGFFAHAPHLRHYRPALQCLAQLQQLFGRPHRENFHAAVAPVSHIPGYVNFPRGVLHKIPVAHSLDSARDYIATRDKPFVHNILSLPEPPAVTPNRRPALPPLRYTGFRTSGGAILCSAHPNQYAPHSHKFREFENTQELLTCRPGGSFVDVPWRDRAGKPRRPANPSARTQSRTHHRHRSARGSTFVAARPN